MGGSPLSLTNNIVKLSYCLPAENSCKIAIMKRILLSCVFVLCAILSWGQSVVVMGKAVTMSNNFSHAKTMLINDGLSVDKTSKLNSANCVVFTNSGKYQDNILIVRLYGTVA